MTGLRGGCTGCRGADGALPKASKIQKERHLLSADVSLLRRDGQNRYFKISKRYRRPTPPAFWPAAHLRRTGALPQAKPRRRRNSLPTSISNSPGYHKNNHTRQVWLFLCVWMPKKICISLRSQLTHLYSYSTPSHASAEKPSSNAQRSPHIVHVPATPWWRWQKKSRALRGENAYFRMLLHCRLALHRDIVRSSSSWEEVKLSAYFRIA